MTASKISDVSANEVAEFIRVIPDTAELQTISAFMVSAKSYILNYTALKDTELDDYPDLVVAFLCLCQDFYDNRYVNGASTSPNKTVQTILDMHVRSGIVDNE